ncbi:SMI1/KNR4 family protein [Mycolicibacterium sphagni]|uniref:SMI1/KNR4 family protein n=1 Tax=Mycolicibacterium sphagni TaxID=1786 RepID=UPI0021F32FE8|nr:SMI1/KNR4 family protein [Mycolicibacterium sphagni]MCV7176385.1 SMI1/KNR4 family protein [Mycolicibacterium sphagni]
MPHDGAVTMAPGLTEDELAAIEAEFGFEFADDHREFLSAGLPVGESWPDWRDAPRRNLQQRLQLPAEGILFAVEWRQFWGAEWGVRPARMKDALRSANYHLARVPQLVPVHANHYLPAGRGSFGHPVLSVYQTDVTCCSTGIFAYVDRELGDADPDVWQAPTPTVRFWSDLIG